MDWLVVEGVTPWEGRYELPLDEFAFTGREWGWIRRFTGYRPADVLDAMKGADAELLAALAVIALNRAGRISRDDAPATFERLVDENFGSFTLTSDDAEEAEPLDPPSPTSSTSNGGSSGDATRNGSGSPETHQPGIPDSATSVFVPARSPI
jgi:hypothetical protein